MAATNLRVVGRYLDGAYRCLIDLDGEDCLYTARYGDDAPLNLWILERVVAWEQAGNVIPDWVQPTIQQPDIQGVEEL